MDVARQAKKLLHAGCGYTKPPDCFDGWQITRLDIDFGVKPDIVADICDTGLPDDGFDAVYCAHTIEHLYAHDVHKAAGEFHRVLVKGGTVILVSPDISKTAEFIVRHGALTKAYDSEAGPIYPLDILYGHQPSVKAGNLHMQHKTGFTKEILGGLLTAAGFEVTQLNSDEQFNLYAIAKKPRHVTIET